MENIKGQDEQCEGRANQESHIHNDLVLLAERRRFLRPDIIYFSANDETRDQLQELALQEPEEVEAIALTNAVANPRAVVVVRRHAMITRFTVFATQWLLNVADGAIFILNEKHHILVTGVIIALIVGQSIINLYNDISNFLNTVVQISWLLLEIIWSILHHF